MLGLSALAFAPHVSATTQSIKTARIIVSLADNENQNIVPIKPSLGNGQNPSQNLYWGALYGIKTHFRRTENWSVNPKGFIRGTVLDAVTLSHKDFSDIQISVEAWDGEKQKDAVKAYFSELRNNVSGANFVGFIGHNALMDTSVPNFPVLPLVRDMNLGRKRKGVVIACKSASYFNPYHRNLGVESYVVTNGSMAPEAYVIEGVLEAWLNNLGAMDASKKAAEKYAEYQKISLRSADRIFGIKSR